MGQQTLYDWLIVIFLHEIPNDQHYSDDMLNAITDAGRGDNMAVFLIWDKLAPGAGDDLSFILNVSRLEKSDAGSWSFLPVTSPDLKIVNQEKNCWETAFRWIYSHYSGERNMLITFSEGAAFGINTQGGRVDRPAAPESPSLGFINLPVQQGSVLTNKYYILDENEIRGLKNIPGFSINGTIEKKGNAWLIEKQANRQLCRNLEILWISQLANALDRYLYGACIDIMLMANCYMQLFDNGYTLSNKVKFLVGAEGQMSFRGYDFGKLMQRLQDTPAMPSKELVQLILPDVGAMYLQKGDIQASMMATLYANRLKFYPLALRVFEDLVADLEPMLPDIAPQLASIRNQMHIVTNSDSYPMVDAGLWIRLVTEQITTLPNAQHYHDLFSMLQSKIVVSSLVSPLISSIDKTAAQQYGYSGISIYYPPDMNFHVGQEVSWCAYFDAAVPAPFRTHSKWNIFLDKYFKALAAIPPQPVPQPAPQLSDQS